MRRPSGQHFYTGLMTGDGSPPVFRLITLDFTVFRPVIRENPLLDSSTSSTSIGWRSFPGIDVPGSTCKSTLSLVLFLSNTRGYKWWVRCRLAFAFSTPKSFCVDRDSSGTWSLWAGSPFLWVVLGACLRRPEGSHAWISRDLPVPGGQFSGHSVV